MLGSISHEFSIGTSDMRHADMLSCHHQVVHVLGIETSKGDVVWLAVTLIPFPVLETKIIFRVTRTKSNEQEG